MCGACAGERCKFDSIGVGVTGTLRRWPVLRHGCAGRRRGVRGERRTIDSLGVGVTGARAAPPVRPDRRGGSKVGVLWVWRPTPGPFSEVEGDADGACEAAAPAAAIGHVDDVLAADRRRRVDPVSSPTGQRSRRQQRNFRRDQTKNRKQNQYQQEPKCTP
jgi:hypothetical protein